MIRALALSVAALAALFSVGVTGLATRAVADRDPNVLVEPAAYQDLRWRSIGPHRGGRSTAAAGVRRQPGVFYMGASGGGVWKTENFGLTWRPVSDGHLATGAIGAIDVSDSDPNVVYVGTGSDAIRSNVILGRGVYKSIDAGRTWAFVGLAAVGQIGQLKVDPTNPDIAFVAAVGNPFGWGPDRGVYRTRNGGRTWEKVLFIDDETGAVSVAINRSNPSEVYAGAWRAQRKPWTIVSGGPASAGGVYKTTDGGDHWTRAGNGLPDDRLGKVWVDVAQSNPKVVYAQVEAPGAKGGLYRSTDAAVTWTLQTNSLQLRTRPFYFNRVFVNPKAENDVWIPEVALHRSLDGGRTWTEVATPHGDNHVVWFNPDDPRLFIETNDGGANVTQDGGASWSSSFNQATAEIYMVDADEQFPYRVYGPQQDDNTSLSLPSLPPTSATVETPSQLWRWAAGCETGQVRPIPSGKIVYGDCKGEFGRLNVETGQEQAYWIDPQQRYGKNPNEMKYRFVRQAPIEVDPRNPAVVYHGSQYLHMTTDGGRHWTRISPDLTRNGPEGHVTSGEPITRDMTGEEVYAALYAIRASRLEPGVIWTGSNDGVVSVTRDGGRSWKNVTPPDLPPGGRVHTIEDSPHRKGSAFVSVSRIYLNDVKPYLYTTTDYGQHWTLLTPGTNGIPADQPMHVVREDPEQEGLLYAGTWSGAFVSFDRGQHWQALQQNLPAMPVTDLNVHKGDLVASTMGRGFWILDDVAPLRQIAASVTRASRPRETKRSDGLPPRGPIAPFDASASLFLFTPAAAYRVRYEPIVGRVDWPEYPPAGARIDYALAPASPEPALDILDAGGTIVRSYRAAPAGAASRRGRLPSALPAKAGMNRFVWDLRYGSGGPLVPPGTYAVRLRSGAVTRTEPLTVLIDPRVAADGVTAADLAAQAKLSLNVRDLAIEARDLAAGVREALGRTPGSVAKLQAVYARLVTKPGPYEDEMFIDQVMNLARALDQADQKIGVSAYERFAELTAEWTAIKADAAAALR